METMISDLVQRYERGGVTRRQLIAGLAMLAATANTGFAMQSVDTAQNNSGTPLLTSVAAVSVNHVGINVSDLKRSVQWYTSLFGLAVLVQGAEVAVLGFPRGDRASTTFVFRPSQKPEINHLMFGIDDFNAEALASFLKSRKLESRPETSSFHIKDPDGLDVQVGDKVLEPRNTVLLPRQ